jgi:hypothetical protein
VCCLQITGISPKTRYYYSQKKAVAKLRMVLYNELGSTLLNNMHTSIILGNIVEFINLLGGELGFRKAMRNVCIQIT